MTIQSAADLQGLQRVGQIVAVTLNRMREALTPGMTTAELDQIGRTVLEKFGAQPAPEYFYQFPGATCISINEEAAHAVPGQRKIRSGDLVNIDVSAMLDGYVADTGASIPVGAVSPMAANLCAAAQAALRAALQVAKAGNRMVDVQQAIERVARKHGFTVIENLAGHGVGRHIHEAPEHVPDYTRRKDRRRFQKGMVLTLEPFLATGARWYKNKPMVHTLATKVGQLVAQYEHTLIITEGKPILVTEGSHLVHV